VTIRVYREFKDKPLKVLDFALIGPLSEIIFESVQAVLSRVIAGFKMIA
jgi:hypothetical protein